MKTAFLRRLAWVALLALAGTPAFAAPALIVHKDLAAEKLTAASVKAIFLGKKVSWDSGARVVLAVLKGGPVAEDFLKAHVDQSASSFNNHWRRLAMTGGGTAPKVFEKEEDLRKFVSETPGAVGFVDSATADSSVVVLTPGA